MKIDSLNQGLFLWIFHADKIPPHIGISTEGKFFSLKANGIDCGVEVKSILNLIDRKKIPSILLELDGIISEKKMKQLFKKYTKTIPQKITCLHPIKLLLEVPSVNKLSELLEELDRHNRVLSKKYFNLPVDFNGIPEYDVEAIHNRLKILIDEA